MALLKAHFASTLILLFNSVIVSDCGVTFSLPGAGQKGELKSGVTVRGPYSPVTVGTSHISLLEDFML